MSLRHHILAGEAVRLLLERGKTVATAESCTGGWIAKCLTDVAGSSAVFGFGWVSYANAAKQAMLGVAPDALAAHGAVSAPVVEAMASGALAASGADHALAVSGIAGPGGGTADKPVGLVWFAWASESGVDVLERRFSGDRNAVRVATCEAALEGLLARL